MSQHMANVERTPSDSGWDLDGTRIGPRLGAATDILGLSGAAQEKHLQQNLPTHNILRGKIWLEVNFYLAGESHKISLKS